MEPLRSKDKRAGIRIPLLSEKVSYFVNGVEHFADVSDITAEGLFLKTDKLLSPRADTLIQLALPGDLASPDQIELRPVDGDALALLPDDRRILVNPGSVGQPRDKNPNASWAVLDTGDLTLEIRRVAYDIETVAAKIRKLGLPDFHAERLRVGA